MAAAKITNEIPRYKKIIGRRLLKTKLSEIKQIPKIMKR